MAKKDDFDFDAESGGKFKFDLSFLANLTKQQKGIILIAAVALVLVIAIVVTVVLIGANSGNDTPVDQGTSDGGTNDGDEGSGTPEVPDEVDKFYISSSVKKLVYYVGESPDYSGLVVYIDGLDDSDVSVSYDVNPELFTFSGFDSSTPVEEQVITVEVGGHTATFTVEIKAVDNTNPILESITVIPPTKTTYSVGMPLDLAGGFIEAHYSNGETVTVTLKMKYVSGYSSIARIPGEHEIKVSYTDEFGGYAETTFTITITE